MQVNNAQPLTEVGTPNISQATQPQQTSLDKESPADSFECSAKNNVNVRTKEEKQEIVYNARKKSAGWSCLFGIFDTVYYGLRSDKTVAKRFDLDPKEDKDLIKTIKREQLKSTLPAGITSLLVPIHPIVGGISYLCYKNSNPDKIEV